METDCCLDILIIADYGLFLSLKMNDKVSLTCSKCVFFDDCARHVSGSLSIGKYML